MSQLTFRAKPEPIAKGGARIWLPFEVEAEWGRRERYHIHGSVDGAMVRGPLVREGDSFCLQLGAAWCRDNVLGEEVEVTLWPEGPQLEGLDADLAEALAASPVAAEFFQSLATFYRKGYLKWLAGAAKRPEVRRERVREWIALLEAGKKSRD